MLALAGSFTQTFTFRPDEVRFSKVNGYDVPELRDYISTSAPGMPIIPQALPTFAVPANATVTGVEVVASERTELPGTYHIHPAQVPIPVSEKMTPSFVPADAAIYGGAAEFPVRLVDWSHTGTKTGFRLCPVSLYPLQYSPATGKVTLYTSLTVRLTYAENSFAAMPLSARQIEVAGADLRSWIANPEALKSSAPPVRESDPNDAEYLIVTSDAYISTLEPLATWHAKKGFNTVFRTVSWITANYTGYDTQEKIRNFIIDYYTNHGTIYVLLAGGHSLIPARRARSVVGSETGNIPADIYYADLQWSWDGNRNRVYGEINGDTVDFYYDVYVGRAPISSTANAQTLVNKVLGYEKSSATGFIKKVYLPWVNLFSGYTGQIVSDTIAAVTPTGWTDTEVNTPSTSAFQSAINGGYGYCHAAAHGDDYGFYTDMGSPIYTTTQASGQSNGMTKLNVMNSMACISGNFENSSALSVVLANNANGGTVANMLNSRYGWGTPPSMGPSEKLCVRFYDFLINMESVQVATAHQRSKECYAGPAQGQEVWRWCYFEYNLLGDPALPLYTDDPGTLTVVAPDSVPTGTQSVRVTVTSGGSPVRNAAVGLYKATEVCARGVTNPSGIADLTVNPGTVGTLYITVSAMNKRPVEDSARVYVGSATPYLSLVNMVVDDAGGSNPNGRLDPGESANLVGTIRNMGTATATNTGGRLRTGSGYISMVDSLAAYGDVLPGATAQGDPFRVTAASGTPPGTNASFVIHVTADQGTWDLPFNLTVGEARQPGAVWANIDTANCLLSVTALGSIGLTEPDGQGNGFKYPRTGVSKLYYGGLLVGNAANYIVDHYYGNPASSVNTDFRLVDSVRRIVPPDMGDEELGAQFSDAGHTTPKGIVVTQRAVQSANPGYDDFTVLVYDIRNGGGTAVTGCYAGIMTDFDIVTSPSPADIARVNPTRRAAYMRGASNQNPTLGLKVLAPAAASNLSVIDHDRYVYPDSAMSESMKFRFLNGQLSFPSSTRNYDWSVVVAAGPFDLAAGATQRVAFAMIGGIDTLSFNANADSAQSWYDRNAGVIETGPGRGNLPQPRFVTLAPNPVTRSARISYFLPESGRLVIRAYDAGGRVAAEVLDRELPAGSGAFDWVPQGMAGGIYFLTASLPSGIATSKFLLSR
jgi:hypothetical protein